LDLTTQVLKNYLQRLKAVRPPLDPPPTRAELAEKAGRSARYQRR
jgi:hypothetical protein